jgi:micrococcal nuclease
VVYKYLAIVERVVDGDTIDVFIDMGFSVWIKQRLRLWGIDAWESRTKDAEEKVKGLAAKKFVEDCCPVGSAVMVKSKKWEGKFGRVIAIVEFHDDAGDLEELNHNLVKAGHAVVKHY